MLPSARTEVRRKCGGSAAAWRELDRRAKLRLAARAAPQFTPQFQSRTNRGGTEVNEPPHFDGAPE